MKYAMNIEIPEEEDFGLLSPDVHYELQVLETLYPSAPAIGTLPNDSKKLVYCVVTCNGIDDFKTFLESLLISYELDWKITALQSWSDRVIPVAGLDEYGEEVVVGWKPEVLIPYDKEIILQYLRDRYLYDSEGNQVGLQEKQMNWSTHYQGQSEWEDTV